MKIIYNGNLLDRSQTPCNEKGWLPGKGIFETIKTVGSKPWAFSRHMRRAVTSAPLAGATIPKEADLRASVEQLLNDQIHERGLLRLSFSNNGDWVAIHLAYSELVDSAKLSVHSQQVPSAGSQVKRFPYDHRLSILKSAQSLGFDEAIVLNEYNNYKNKFKKTDVFINFLNNITKYFNQTKETFIKKLQTIDKEVMNEYLDEINK